MEEARTESVEAAPSSVTPLEQIADIKDTILTFCDEHPEDKDAMIDILQHTLNHLKGGTEADGG